MNLKELKEKYLEEYSFSFSWTFFIFSFLLFSGLFDNICLASSGCCCLFVHSFLFLIRSRMIEVKVVLRLFRTKTNTTSREQMPFVPQMFL